MPILFPKIGPRPLPQKKKTLAELVAEQKAAKAAEQAKLADILDGKVGETNAIIKEAEKSIEEKPKQILKFAFASKSSQPNTQQLPTAPIPDKPPETLPDIPSLPIQSPTHQFAETFQSPDKQLKQLEKMQEARATIVPLPVLSFKDMLAKQQKEFEIRYNDPTDIGRAKPSVIEGGTIPTVETKKLFTLPDKAPSLTVIQPAQSSQFPIVKLTEPKLEFDPSQQAALEGMLEEQFSCLIGKAGTGKTTILKELMRLMKEKVGTVSRVKFDAKSGEKKTTYHLAMVCCAFTGRAVEQMKKALDKEYHQICGTIHGEKVLAFMPEEYMEDDEFGFPKAKFRFVPTYGETMKLPYKVYIIDESGMLDTDLWNLLRAAMLTDAKVIMVGDINQLPPVYGRSVLGYAMTKWPVFELTTIHRQAANNPIIANAHKILEGLPPMKVKGKFDIEDLGDRGSDGTFKRTGAIIKHIHEAGIFDPFRDGFIVPQNVGTIGQVAFNESLTPYFNPSTTPETKRYLVQTGINTVHFAAGDKVMVLANDKDAGLTNGQIGKVVRISANPNWKNKAQGFSQLDIEKMHTIQIGDDEGIEEDINKLLGPETKEDKKDAERSQNERQASHIVTVAFGQVDKDELDDLEYSKQRVGEIDAEIATKDNLDANYRQKIYSERKRLHSAIEDLEKTVYKAAKEVSFSTAGQFRKLAHAYCITCHKSQGGEYPVVVILLHSANVKMLSREWLYTAVTRARNRVILVCNQRALGIALRNQRIKGRNLAEKIQSFVKLAEEEAQNKGAMNANLPNRAIWEFVPQKDEETDFEREERERIASLKNDSRGKF